MPRLDGTTAFITGIAGGQGRAAAVRFAREGATVIGCDREAGAALDHTVNLVREADGAVLASQVDLTDPAAVARWIDDGLAHTGSMDTLYNNAASARFGSFPDFTGDDWEYVVHNELMLVVAACRHAWPALAASRGCIINTCSTSALTGSTTFPQAAHSAAKAAVLGLTVQLAGEGAALGIRANCISPGLIASPATEHMLHEPPLSEVAARIPLGRIGQPDDIAAAAVFLASADAAYITGANLVVDGGWTSLR